MLRTNLCKMDYLCRMLNREATRFNISSGNGDGVHMLLLMPRVPKKPSRFMSIVGHAGRWLSEGWASNLEKGKRTGDQPRRHNASPQLELSVAWRIYMQFEPLRGVLSSCYPQVVGLIESRLDHVKCEFLWCELGFFGCFSVPSVGRSGGLVLYYRQGSDLSILNYSQFHICCVLNN